MEHPKQQLLHYSGQLLCTFPFLLGCINNQLPFLKYDDNWLNAYCELICLLPTMKMFLNVYFVSYFFAFFWQVCHFFFVLFLCNKFIFWFFFCFVCVPDEYTVYRHGLFDDWSIFYTFCEFFFPFIFLFRLFLFCFIFVIIVCCKCNVCVMCTICIAIGQAAETIKNDVICIGGRLIATYTIYEASLMG